jgi:hypothetical protein
MSSWSVDRVRLGGVHGSRMPSFGTARRPAFFLAFAAAITVSNAYLVVVKVTGDDSQTIVNSTLDQCQLCSNSQRTYKYDAERHSARLFHVSSSSGIVSTRNRRLDCRGLHYPNPFLFRVSSWASDERDLVRHVSVPIRVFIADANNPACGSPAQVKGIVNEYRQWNDVTVASVRISTGCFVGGQFVLSLDSVLPSFFREKRCVAKKFVAEPSDRWAVEPKGESLLSNICKLSNSLLYWWMIIAESWILHDVTISEDGAVSWPSNDVVFGIIVCSDSSEKRLVEPPGCCSLADYSYCLICGQLQIYSQVRRCSLFANFIIDYRCDNRRFRLSAHNCQVPTPTSQNLELKQQIRIFGAD